MIIDEAEKQYKAYNRKFIDSITCTLVFSGGILAAGYLIFLLWLIGMLQNSIMR